MRGAWKGLLCAAALACVAAAPARGPLDRVAEAYVHLTLRVAQHDKDYIDAYFGPRAWVNQAKAHPGTTAELEADSDRLIAQARHVNPRALKPMERRRRAFLISQLGAVRAKLEKLDGRTFTYREEARALYGIDPDLKPLTAFDADLAAIEALVPGPGTLADRVAAFRAGFVVPKDRLGAVVGAAVAECRKRARAHLALPADERFDLEVVSGKPWAAYNWYKGAGRSLIQVNTDYPIPVDRALELGCHEGYPGHHVHNTLLEQRLAKGRGWVEFQVYPLSTPFFFVAEGIGNAAPDVAFPGDERIAFERDVLFPLAGLDPREAARYVAVSRAVKRIAPAAMTITADYVDGRIDAETATAQIQRYALLSRDQAQQSVKLMTYYRAYGVNYGLGEAMVRAAVARGGPSPADHWRALERLLSEPVTPADLGAAAPAPRKDIR